MAHLRKSGTLPTKLSNLPSITHAHTAWDALRMIVYDTHPCMGVCRILYQGYPNQTFRHQISEFWNIYLDVLQLKNVFHHIPFEFSQPETIETFLEHCYHSAYLQMRYQAESNNPAYAAKFDPRVLPQTLQAYIEQGYNNSCWKKFFTTDRHQQGRERTNSFRQHGDRPHVRRPTPGDNQPFKPQAIHQLETQSSNASVASADLANELQIAQLSQQRPCLVCKKVHDRYQCPALTDIGLATVASQKEFFLLRSKEYRSQNRDSTTNADIRQLQLESQVSASTSTTETIPDFS